MIYAKYLLKLDQLTIIYVELVNNNNFFITIDVIT